jgi:hypothetical protein
MLAPDEGDAPFPRDLDFGLAELADALAIEEVVKPIGEVGEVHRVTFNEV